MKVTFCGDCLGVFQLLMFCEPRECGLAFLHFFDRCTEVTRA